MGVWQERPDIDLAREPRRISKDQVSRICKELAARVQRALLSVVQEAYIPGVSTRAVDNLAEALGITI